MAAAIGAGLPVSEPTGNMVVDIGGGTTEVAVISLGGIVTSTASASPATRSTRRSSRTSRRSTRWRWASAPPRRSRSRSARRSRCRRTTRPRSAAATSSPGCRRRSWWPAEEIRRAIEEPVNSIVDAVKTTLDKCPPELSGDIMDRGIVLAGGGANLRGLDERLRHETGMPILIADNPLHSVAIGSGRCVEDFEALQQVLVVRAQRSLVLTGRAPR